MITNGTQAVLPMTFYSNRDVPGEFIMRVTVLKEYFFSKRKIAEGSCKFLITRDIVGRIVVSQDGHILPDNQTTVSTNRPTNFTFEFHDPSGYFSNASTSLSWKLNYGLSQYAPYFTVNFTDTEDHQVYLIVVALVNRPSSSSPQIKVGSFTHNVTPKGLLVTNDGPAILDSTIIFRAKLLDSEKFGTVRYLFRHNVPSAAQPEIITNGTQAVLPVTFLSNRDQPGEYLMVVSALADDHSNRRIAEGSSKFSLTRDIVGKIVVSQEGHILPDDQTIVSTNRTTNFTFDMHDPSHFFNGSFRALSWKLDQGLAHYGPFYTLNFTDTEVHSVHLTVVELVDMPNSTAPLVKLGSYIRIVTPVEVRRVSGPPITQRRQPRQRIIDQAQREAYSLGP